MSAARIGNPGWEDDHVDATFEDDHVDAALTDSEFEERLWLHRVLELDRESWERSRFALSLAEFIALESDEPPALLGAADDAILPAHGLAILGGKPGAGKTTLAIDAAFHLASGVEWLEMPVPEPLRVLVVENEGPLQPFRRKLERKAASWEHEIPGAIFVHTLAWGALSFADEAKRQEMAAFLERERIDVVFGDPLGSLGVQGVGSPAETRDFMALLSSIGLFRACAFVLLHHFRKEPSADEIDELSGSWSGHADSLLVVKDAGPDRTRLSFPKLRWAETRDPLILERADGGFTVVVAEHVAGADERDVTEQVRELLADSRGGPQSRSRRRARAASGRAAKTSSSSSTCSSSWERLRESKGRPEGIRPQSASDRLARLRDNLRQRTLRDAGARGCLAGRRTPLRGHPAETTLERPLSEEPEPAELEGLGWR